MARLGAFRRCTQTRILAVVLVSVSVLWLPAGCRQTRHHASTANIDSNSLKQTVVVATLECPLPEHKNVIWCSTFQMAWDKFKHDIIGEPIQVPAVQMLADRLNRSPFPAGGIEEKSYYAVAGLVEKGIIEEVQREMKRRFPSEPVPAFASRYRALPGVVLAYAYLNVDIGFRYPYYIHRGGFDFQDSSGVRTGVTAFGAQTSGRAGAEKPVRDQVEVLYYDNGRASGTVQFAVDLSRQTQPYQVVLARMPRCDTLGAAGRMLQEKMAAFRSDPNFAAGRGLRYGDTLIVPDVLFKLTHHFGELLGPHLGNRKWADHFFFEALQKIDFTLSRTGVVLKSQSRLTATKSAAVEARRLHFDGPFLICVQRREPNATPFFLMWVDNAELMQAFPSRGRQ